MDNLKKLTKERRPAPFAGNHSFPSGHTSSSFAGAEFMHAELKNSLAVLGWVGYLGASATATIRLAKNRHWLKDVVAGGAIGILSTKLAYFLVNKAVRKKNKKEINNLISETNERIMPSEILEC